MKPHQRLLLFLLFVLALTCLLSPWFALSADWIMERYPGLFSERYSFSKIFNRTFMISGILLFIFGRRLLGIRSAAQLGLTSWRRDGSDILVGWMLAMISMAGLMAAMTVSDVFTPFFRLSLADSLARCFSALMSGIFAGFLEEIFFRGILFKGLYRQGRMRAYVGANLFYSALHFVKPEGESHVTGIEPLAGFKHLASTFMPFLDPVPLLAGIFGLFLLGVVLSFAFVRTGNLYLAIGLHAGWVFGLKTMRVFGDFSRADLGWLYGITDPKIVSGVATWTGFILVALAVYRITRCRSGLSCDPPGPTTA